MLKKKKKKYYIYSIGNIYSGQRKSYVHIIEVPEGKNLTSWNKMLKDII